MILSRRRALLAGPAVVLAVALGLAGCDASGGSPGPSQPEPTASPTPSGPATGAPPRPRTEPGTGEYLAGLPVTVRLPREDPAAVVVLVPGGGWSRADPRWLAPLGEHLVSAGLAVVTITYGTSSTGTSWPVPADDVRCAVAYAAQEVPDVPVVVAGHSAGAHLSAVVGLVPEGTDAFCPYPARASDGVVGLAGPYDVSATRGLAGNLFGVPEPEAPELWAQGNPVLLADRRPELPFLLVHGSEDELVGEQFARGFEAALTAQGHPVELVVIEGATHGSVVQPDVVGDLVAEWVLTTVAAS
ncbi:MAG: alpha/beta hydrolase [Actinotalea sp.]|nr:alpha/beta hydrolase [Actinotalea sp.]